MVLRAAFECVSDAENRRFIERFPQELEPDRHSVAETAGHRKTR
jgi:hypothetical protein